MDALTRREALIKASAAATLLALPATLTACGGDGGTTPTNSVDGRSANTAIRSLTWAMSAGPQTLDVATGWSDTGIQVMTLGLEGLVAIDSKNQVVPRLAESWTQPDPLHYVYELRPGVKFWDGTPLTVEDVVWSMARHLDTELASQIAFTYERVKSVTATGPAEITVELSEPDPEFQFVPAWSFVTPKAFSERLGKKLGVAGGEVNTMGTGPFQITEFDTDTGVTLVRNHTYWGDAGDVEGGRIEVITDPNDLSLALESGDVDGACTVAIESLRDLSRNPEIGLDFPAPLSVWFVVFEVNREPFDDIRVRRAIAHAADTEGMVKTFLGDAGAPATALPSPDQWAGLAPPERVEEIYAQIPRYPFDLEAAKRELAQSKHPDGFSASIEYPSNEKLFGKALVSLSESVKEIGIELKVVELPQSKWLADLYGHTQPTLGMGLVPTTPDPSNYLNGTCLSKNARKNGLNVANFRNKEVDRLLREQAATIDKEQRATLIGDVLRIVGEELPYLPLWWVAKPLALNQEYVYNGFTQLFYMQNWLANLEVRA